MGKASKWIRNFLIGKKEDKYKQIEAGSSEMGSPTVKCKWSFGRKTGKVAEHKYSTSFDLADSAKLQIRAILETRPPHTTLLPTPTPFSHIEHAAATKIQAAFRSYLGRKALLALRGLVKLQALVRGHLVRQKTTTTLRSMHALMSIQVRARIHRIQTAQESNLLRKHPSQNKNKGHIREYKDPKDMNLREMPEVLRSRSGPLDRPPPRRSMKRDSMTLSSKNLSVSKRHHRYSAPNSPRNLSVSKRHHRYSAPNSPQDYLALSGSNPTKALSTSLRHHQSWEPNYMTKTESSRAKARSESEPKQRPRRSMRHNNINKPIESRDGGSGRQIMSSNSTRFNNGNLDLYLYG